MENKKTVSVWMAAIRWDDKTNKLSFHEPYLGEMYIEYFNQFDWNNTPVVRLDIPANKLSYLVSQDKDYVVAAWKGVATCHDLYVCPEKYLGDDQEPKRLDEVGDTGILFRRREEEE